MFHFKCHLVWCLLRGRILLHIILKLPCSVVLTLKTLYVLNSFTEASRLLFFFLPCSGINTRGKGVVCLLLLWGEGKQKKEKPITPRVDDKANNAEEKHELIFSSANVRRFGTKGTQTHAILFPFFNCNLVTNPHGLPQQEERYSL